MSAASLDALIVCLSALAPAVAGAVEFPAQIPLLGAAIVLMARDNRRVATKLPVVVLALAGVFVALCAAAFLPASWLGGSDVRQQLTAALDLDLGGQVSLQPWVTLECLLVLGVNFVWGYFLLTRSWSWGRARIMAGFCTVLAVLAVVSIVFFVHGSRPPFWPAAPFGPCPNRNETGFIFGLAGLISFCLAFRKSNQKATQHVLWLGVFLLFGVALTLNLSRSGILILLGGPLLWLVVCAVTKQKRTPDVLRLGVALGMVGVLFLIFGGKAVRRFGEVAETPMADYRVVIQKDALQLVHQASLVGVGAGNFEAIFPFFRTASWNDKRALHPESDWVCLAAELGWLAVPIAWALLFWCVWRTTATLGQRDGPLMLGAGVGGFCLFAHGFADMNAHRMGAVWPVLLVLAAGQPRPADDIERVPRTWWWRGLLVGLGALVLLAWVGPRFQWNYPGTTLRRRLDTEFTAAGKAGDYVKARQLTEQSLKLTPLDWRLYFQRAWVTLASRGEVNDAVLDFARARALEPNLPDLPVLEFQYWWAFGWPQQTSLALEECFRRGGYTGAMFDHVFALCRHDPGLISALLAPAARQPTTQLRYLRDAPPELFKEMLQLVVSHPLSEWSDEQRVTLFRLWSEHAERTLLPDYLETHPEEMPHAWAGLARAKMQAGQHEAAGEVIARWSKPPKLPTLAAEESLARLQNKLHLNSADWGTVFILVNRHQNEGRMDDALQLLSSTTERANAPNYFHYLSYQLHAGRRDWPAASAAWLRYDAGLLRTGRK